MVLVSAVKWSIGFTIGCNYHKGRAAIRHYANQPARLLWLLRRQPNFTSTYCGVGAFSVNVQLCRLIVYSTTCYAWQSEPSSPYLRDHRVLDVDVDECEVVPAVAVDEPHQLRHPGLLLPPPLAGLHLRPVVTTQPLGSRALGPGYSELWANHLKGWW